MVARDAEGSLAGARMHLRLLHRHTDEIALGELTGEGMGLRGLRVLGRLCSAWELDVDCALGVGEDERGESRVWSSFVWTLLYVWPSFVLLSKEAIKYWKTYIRQTPLSSGPRRPHDDETQPHALRGSMRPSRLSLGALVMASLGEHEYLSSESRTTMGWEPGRTVCHME